MSEVTRRDAIKAVATGVAVVSAGSAAKAQDEKKGKRGSEKGLRSMTKKRVPTELLTPNEVRATQTDLKALSADVHKVMSEYGLTAGANCKTICTAHVVIGPDGKPKPMVDCQLVCEF